MKSPIVLLKDKLPQELINKVQSYMKNDNMVTCLREYYNYLIYEQELYENFVLKTYIMPQCYCHRLRRNKDCSHCYEFEYTDMYKFDSYITCVMENDQYIKIAYN